MLNFGNTFNGIKFWIQKARDKVISRNLWAIYVVKYTLQLKLLSPSTPPWIDCFFFALCLFYKNKQNFDDTHSSNKEIAALL